MTDEEILKGLKACGVDGTCADCPYDTPYIPDTPPDCSERMMKDAFDLVTRQKEEIRELQNHRFVEVTGNNSLLKVYLSVKKVKNVE